MELFMSVIDNWDNTHTALVSFALASEVLPQMNGFKSNSTLQLIGNIAKAIGLYIKSKGK